MLLAASAGQAAPYTSYESTATRKINNKNNNSNNNVNPSPPTTANAAGTVAAATRPTTASSIASTAACAIMKTLSVRLHRGTEFIKDTMQKALVMSATTPVMQPMDKSQQQQHQQHQHQNLKRKLTGAGGIMSSGSGMGSGLGGSRQFTASQPYVVPTAAFLRRFTVAPSALHRSASARKRNPSTDSLLMDLCFFKPIRPMPKTPIKINKARGFELKRPKFMPPITNMYSDTDEDDEDQDDDGDGAQIDDETLKKETEVAYKPKLSTLILPQHATASAFVPHEATKKRSRSTTEEYVLPTHTKDNKHNANTHTSDADSNSASATSAAAPVMAAASTCGLSKPKPAVATKRRRRAPLLTAKRRRKTAPASKEIEPIVADVAAAAPKRKRRNADAATVAAESGATTISPLRRSPPMTRQRARQQISASRK